MLRRLTLPLALFAVFSVALAACGDDDEVGDGPEPTASVPTLDGAQTSATTGEPADGGLSLTSSAFEDNGTIPVKYTCNGENVLPPLTIADAPEDTASFAITTTDLDGPSGDFVHWTVWNIDPVTTEIPEASVPIGAVEGATGRGAPGFFGPCPPSGEHRYVFDLYALDISLTLNPTADKAALLAAMEGQILEQTSLTGLYEAAVPTGTP